MQNQEKNGIDDLFAKQKQRHRCREQTYRHQKGSGEGGGEMDWEIGILTYVHYQVQNR